MKKITASYLFFITASLCLLATFLVDAPTSDSAHDIVAGNVSVPTEEHAKSSHH